MFFKFYSNAVSQASRTVAATAFIIGMMLIGFGMLIWALPELFAFLAAMLFFIAGISCAGFAIRMFIAAKTIEKAGKANDQQPFRDNVRIHHDPIDRQDF
ncbi:MAG: hypothetical protein PHF37_08320 [Phycisphaerae bacterium]|nr:hypothetical protein [Phycisphaerae bacterium]